MSQAEDKARNLPATRPIGLHRPQSPHPLTKATSVSAPPRHLRRTHRHGRHRPAKAVRTALQNAASVASFMLTTECLIAERPKDEKAIAEGGSHERHGHGGF